MIFNLKTENTMSALIIAIYLWLGGMFGANYSTSPTLVQEYQIESQQEKDSTKDNFEWDVLGG
jgi:hypothetical protein